MEPLRDDDIDFLIETSRPPVSVAPAPFGEVERKIAAHAGGFIPDRATVQVGLGAIPEAILSSLSDRRGLGIHSRIIGDRLVDLVQAGIVTNEHKPFDVGITTTGLLAGTRRLYDFADGNPGLLMAPVSHTHRLEMIRQLSRFVALNSALEADLTGQVNAEAIGADYMGLVGGQVDFVRGANAAPNGCAIFALRSTTTDAASRIVAKLSGPVTTSRSDVGVIITEHGAADLRGLPVRERIARMLAIADPSHREGLEREGHALLS